MSNVLIRNHSLEVSKIKSNRLCVTWKSTAFEQLYGWRERNEIITIETIAWYDVDELLIWLVAGWLAAAALNFPRGLALLHLKALMWSARLLAPTNAADGSLRQ